MVAVERIAGIGRDRDFDRADRLFVPAKRAQAVALVEGEIVAAGIEHEQLVHRGDGSLVPSEFTQIVRLVIAQELRLRLLRDPRVEGRERRFRLLHRPPGIGDVEMELDRVGRRSEHRLEGADRLLVAPELVEVIAFVIAEIGVARMLRQRGLDDGERLLVALRLLGLLRLPDRRCARPGRSTFTAEDLQDALLTERLRMLQRGLAVAIPEVLVRTRLDQSLDHVAIEPAAVAEDHRLQQRRPAEIVCMVHRNAGGQADPHRAQKTLLARRQQRRAAEAVDAVRVGARGDGELQDLVEAVRARAEIGREHGDVADIDVAAGRDQAPRQRQVVLLGRRHQRRAAGLVLGVHLGALGEKALDGNHIALVGGGNQGRVGGRGVHRVFLSIGDAAPGQAPRKA